MVEIGGKEDEEIQVLGEFAMEIPGAVEFRFEGRVIVLYGHVGESRVPEDHGSLDAALDRGHTRCRTLVQRVSQRGAV